MLTHQLQVRPMAVAECRHCTWKAQCTGDDTMEAVVTLRHILLQHVKDDHPDLDSTAGVLYRPTQLKR